MLQYNPSANALGRRRFFVRAIAAIQSAIGGTLAFILGGAILAPAFQRPGDSWLRAASLDSVPDDEPLPVTLRVVRRDGFTDVVDRTVVYLVRSGERVRALQATCTHLGCRTSYDRQSRSIRCPCHGGMYDIQGNVIAGPPPAALPELTTRIEDGHVMVRI